jgi:hypothetical protein
METRPQPEQQVVQPLRTRRQHRWWLFIGCLLLLAGGAFWLYASIVEFQTGQRLWPWSAYAFCGSLQPTALPQTVRVGLYEEFPNPWRLAKLRQLDFPVTLAVAAGSRAEFFQLRETIRRTYPQVREVYFWPLLTPEEGYYPGPWSSPVGVQRLTADATDVPLLWDLEIPRGTTSLRSLSLAHWWANHRTLTRFFADRSQPVHIWRTHVSMGLNPTFLRLTAMHVDPVDYPQVRLHLDLYTTGAGQNADELTRILRCGVERYGARFIPSFGVLNDQEGPAEIFVPPDTFRRNLRLARTAGVSEIWIFGVNGLNSDYLDALRDSLPLESLPLSSARRQSEDPHAPTRP